jgi:hypothetical protein
VPAPAECFFVFKIAHPAIQSFLPAHLAPIKGETKIKRGLYYFFQKFSLTKYLVFLRENQAALTQHISFPMRSYNRKF